MQEDRRIYPAEFKGKVALAAIKNDKSISELAFEFSVSPELIVIWKQQVVANISRVFEEEDDDGIDTETCDNNIAHAKIGDLIAENDFLTKVLGR